MTVTYDLTPLSGTLNDKITLTYDASSEPGYKLAIWWINYNEETDGNKTYSNLVGDDKRLAIATSTTKNDTIQITQELLDKDIKTISLFYIQTDTNPPRFSTPLSEATLLKTWNVHYEKTNLYYKLRTLGNQWFYTKSEIDEGTIIPTNKNYITTSFTPSKLKTAELNATINGSEVSLAPVVNGRAGLIVFRFECNDGEYYMFNIVVQSTTSINVCDVNGNYVYATLETGTHTIKISQTQLIIDNTSITYSDTYTYLGFENNSQDNITVGEFYFSHKEWHHEATFFDKIYPIGSVHITTNSVNPSNYFDGEWERIQDRFLLASGATYENGSTGGSATVTLTSAQSGVPAHSHKYQDYNTTYTLKTTNRKPGTSTAVAYGTSLTAGGGATERTSSNNTTANASQPHENMPPYLAVYMWKRIR